MISHVITFTLHVREEKGVYTYSIENETLSMLGASLHRRELSLHLLKLMQRDDLTADVYSYTSATGHGGEGIGVEAGVNLYHLYI